MTPAALNAKPFWSPDEVAELLPDGNARAVSRWCKTGKIPGAKKLPSGRWAVPSGWVGDLLSSAGVQEPASPTTPGE